MVSRRRLFLLPTLCLVWSEAARADGSPPLADEVPADEVIVTGRRPVIPDDQEQRRFHDAEYERLRRIYDPPAHGDRMRDILSVPNPDQGKSAIPSPNSAVVQGRPTQR